MRTCGISNESFFAVLDVSMPESIHNLRMWNPDEPPRCHVQRKHVLLLNRQKEELILRVKESIKLRRRANKDKE